MAWHEGNAGGVAQLVASRQPNPFGLYDMQGNVWEWVVDCYDARAWAYVEQPGFVNDDGFCTERVARGGSVRFASRNLRPADRDRFPASSRDELLGFRCVAPPAR